MSQNDEQKVFKELSIIYTIYTIYNLHVHHYVKSGLPLFVYLRLHEFLSHIQLLKYHLVITDFHFDSCRN